MSGGTKKTGLIGPVAFYAAVSLIVLSPVFRGGNRHIALIGLEALSLLLLLCIYINAKLGPQAVVASSCSLTGRLASKERTSLLARALLTSPVILGCVHLTPVPGSWWEETPGRAIYAQTLQSVGLALPDFLPLSLNPVATWTSLLAAVPLIAAFVVGQNALPAQLITLVKVLFACAVLQVLIGVLQLVSGPESVLYFDGGYHDSATGSFANRSHYANYIAMILPLYAWLGLTSGNRDVALAQSEQQRERAQSATGRKLLWILGGSVLVFGVLISRSRGAALTGLALGLAAVFVLTVLRGVRLNWRAIAFAAVFCMAIFGVLLGFDFVSSRYIGSSLGDSASFRALLASSSLNGAWQFWPWGAGWGTYEAVYPRFQPPSVAGYAEYAHHDYIQMLFEGGIFAVVLLCIWFGLFFKRAFQLVQFALAKSVWDAESLLSVASGMALIGVMLHALVEFSLHIPANAILAAFIAGIYLRRTGHRVSPALKK